MRRTGRAALSFLLPTFLLLVDPSTSSPTREHTTATTHLLQLAAQDPAAFREATAALEPDQRTALEAAVRQSVGPTTAVATRDARPAIDLKMSFG
jgi:hypothetical protein